MNYCDFTDDAEKMRDFHSLTKEEFLATYSYLTEEEWELTAKKVQNTHERSLDDYTLEYCPYCDSYEQVIYSKGVTACPTCGKPLAPCSMCESCNYATCPYGCDGSEKDGEKPIDHYITQEEIDWYNKACAEWLKEHNEQISTSTESEGGYPQAVDNSHSYNQWSLTYNQWGKPVDIGCFSKTVIIREYLLLAEAGQKHGITDLKVLRNGVDYTKRLTAFLSEDEDKNAWETILFMLSREPRSYDTADDPGYWTNGDEILCSCKAEANMVAEFLTDTFSEWGKLDLVTGYYDPFEDAQNNEQDDNTGFWYIRPNGA